MQSNEEIYPMPSFANVNVADLERSSRWYQKVGFRHVFTMPGPGGGPGLVHLRWRKYADLLLTSRAGAPGPRGVGIVLTFSCYDHAYSVDDVAERAKAAGGKILAPPAQMPWNARECTIQDPDGYALAFSQPVHTGRSFESVLEDVVKSDFPRE